MTVPLIRVSSTPERLEASVIRDLNLPEGVASDRAAIVAAMLRRLASFMCPCAEGALLSAMRRSLRGLPTFESCDDDFVSTVIERLLTGGDLLELSRVVMSGVEVEDRPTWLFCAPPGYVVRGDRAYVVGVAPDDAHFLPASLQERIRSDGATRFLSPQADERLPDVLLSLGLRKISQETWLSNRNPEAAGEAVDRALKRLRRDGVHGDLPGLTVIRHADGQTVPYAARWAEPTGRFGIHIGRAPQPYGARLWFVVDLRDGEVMRSLLLPYAERPERACDQAWRLQLAIDAVAGFPATFHASSVGGDHRLDFNFPLPIDARRRLLFIGGREVDAQAAYSVQISNSQLEIEKEFLRMHCWMRSRDNEEQPGESQ